MWRSYLLTGQASSGVEEETRSREGGMKESVYCESLSYLRHLLINKHLYWVYTALSIVLQVTNMGIMYLIWVCVERAVRLIVPYLVELAKYSIFPVVPNKGVKIRTLSLKFPLGSVNPFFAEKAKRKKIEMLDQVRSWSAIIVLSFCCAVFNVHCIKLFTFIQDANVLAQNKYITKKRETK